MCRRACGGSEPIGTMGESLSVLKPLLLLLAVLAVFGCGSPERIDAITVRIPESGNIRADVALAREVTDDVWAAGLKDVVKAQFPAMTEDDLAGLFIRWEEVRTVTSAGTTRRAQIVVGIAHNGRIDGAAVAEFCAEQVARRIGSGKLRS